MIFVVNKFPIKCIYSDTINVSIQILLKNHVVFIPPNISIIYLLKIIVFPVIFLQFPTFHPKNQAQALNLQRLLLV